MPSDESADEVAHQLCEVGVGFDLSENEGGSFNVEERGHKCYNDAVGKYRLETSAGASMEFWLCEAHLEGERDAGNVIGEVSDRAQ